MLKVKLNQHSGTTRRVNMVSFDMVDYVVTVAGILGIKQGIFHKADSKVGIFISQTLMWGNG